MTNTSLPGGIKCTDFPTIKHGYHNHREEGRDYCTEEGYLSAEDKKKRRLMDTSFEAIDIETHKRKEDPIAHRVIEAIQGLNSQIKLLEKIIDNSTNIKREVKETAIKIRGWIDVLNKDSCKEWMENKRYEPTEGIKKHIEIQTDHNNKRSIGIQTGESTLNSRQELQNINTVDEM
ncbi:hypothetical protein FQR65_LT13456 [Abscondita terminalis]|nr:hypothetical protein FQR65_LT13456 [Abscondita terminalis]